MNIDIRTTWAHKNKEHNQKEIKIQQNSVLMPCDKLFATDNAKWIDWHILPALVYLLPWSTQPSTLIHVEWSNIRTYWSVLGPPYLPWIKWPPVPRRRIFLSDKNAFLYEFPRSLFVRVQLEITQHWFDKNGLPPNRRQDIRLTNSDPIHWRIYSAIPIYVLFTK